MALAALLPTVLSSQISELNVSVSNFALNHNFGFYKTCMGSKPFAFDKAHAHFLLEKMRRVFWPIGTDPRPELPFTVYGTPNYNDASGTLGKLLDELNFDWTYLPKLLYGRLELIGSGEYGEVYRTAYKSDHDSRIFRYPQPRRRPVQRHSASDILSSSKATHQQKESHEFALVVPSVVSIPKSVTVVVKMQPITLPLGEDEFLDERFETSSFSELRALIQTSWLSTPQYRNARAPKLYRSSAHLKRRYIEGEQSLIYSQSFSPCNVTVEEFEWNLHGFDALPLKIAQQQTRSLGEVSALKSYANAFETKDVSYLASATELFVKPYGVYFSAPGRHLYNSSFSGKNSGQMGWMYVEMEDVNTSAAAITELYADEAFMFEWIFGEAALAKHAGLCVGDRAKRNMGLQKLSYSRVYHIGGDSYYIPHSSPMPKRFDLGIITKFSQMGKVDDLPETETKLSDKSSLWSWLKRKLCLSCTADDQFGSREVRARGVAKPSTGHLVNSNPFYGILNFAEAQSFPDSVTLALRELASEFGKNFQTVFQRRFSKFLVDDDLERLIANTPDSYASDLNRWHSGSIRHYYF